MTDLKQKREQLVAELEAVDKAIADAESHYPKKGTYGYVLCPDGQISHRKFYGDVFVRAMFDQGNWFFTIREAELTHDYRAAVVRINRAIRAGERGDASPWLEGEGSFLDWSSAYQINPVFCLCSSESIKAVIKSHADDFEAVRKYINEVLK